MTVLPVVTVRAVLTVLTLTPGGAGDSDLNDDLFEGVDLDNDDLFEGVDLDNDVFGAVNLDNDVVVAHSVTSSR